MNINYEMEDFNDSPTTEEEILTFNPPIGASKVDEIIGNASWLWDFLRYCYPPDGENGYVDAHSAMVRIIAVAATLCSINPSDLRVATGLPILFVRMVLLILQSAQWEEILLPDLWAAIDDGPDVRAIKVLIENFVHGEEFPDLSYVDLLKAVGPEILGVGRTPFGVERPSPTLTDHMEWLESLPPSNNAPLPIEFMVVDEEECGDENRK